jgi:hypothetical protein
VFVDKGYPIDIVERAALGMFSNNLMQGLFTFPHDNDIDIWIRCHFPGESGRVCSANDNEHIRDRTFGNGCDPMNGMTVYTEHTADPDYPRLSSTKVGLYLGFTVSLPEVVALFCDGLTEEVNDVNIDPF